MDGFRGTNAARHPWFLQDYPMVELPPTCKVNVASHLLYPITEDEDGDLEDDS